VSDNAAVLILAGMLLVFIYRVLVLLEGDR
jgi:hypothetical protein